MSPTPLLGPPGGADDAGAAVLPWWNTAVPLGRAAVSGHTYADTLATLGRMAILVRWGAEHPVIQQAAVEAWTVAGKPQSRAARARAVFAWLKPRVRFTPDAELVAAAARASGLNLAPDAELLIAPWQLLTMQPAMGDCDDFTMAAGALLRALGVPCELAIIAADGTRPAEFTHVYLQAVLEDGARLPLDVSHGPYAGWEAPTRFDKQVWPILELRRGTGLAGIDPVERRALYGAGVSGLGFSLPTGGVTVSEGGGGWGSVFQNIATAGASTGLSILGARLGQPSPGTYIQTKEGTYYRGGAGEGNLPFPPASSGSGTWVLLGAGVLLLVLLGRR